MQRFRSAAQNKHLLDSVCCGYTDNLPCLSAKKAGRCLPAEENRLFHLFRVNKLCNQIWTSCLLLFHLWLHEMLQGHTFPNAFWGKVLVNCIKWKKSTSALGWWLSFQGCWWSMRIPVGWAVSPSNLLAPWSGTAQNHDSNFRSGDFSY